MVETATPSSLRGFWAGIWGYISNRQGYEKILLEAKTGLYSFYNFLQTKTSVPTCIDQ